MGERKEGDAGISQRKIMNDTINRPRILFRQSYLDKSKYWQTIPNLPSMNINLIRNAYKKIKVSEKYKQRNLKIKPIIFE